MLSIFHSLEISHYIYLSCVLFSIGLFGVLFRRNAIILLMCIELMLNAVNLSFVGFAQSMNSLNGVMFIFFIIVVAAAEAVVGLSIILSLYRSRRTLNIDEFNLLRW